MSPLIGILLFSARTAHAAVEVRYRRRPLSDRRPVRRISQPFPRAHGRMSADIRTGGTPIRWMGGRGPFFRTSHAGLVRHPRSGKGKGRDVGGFSNIPPVASLMPYGGSERSSDHLAACTPCLTVEVLRRAPKRVTPTPPKAMRDSRTPPMAMPVLARSSR